MFCGHPIHMRSEELVVKTSGFYSRLGLPHVDSEDSEQRKAGHSQKIGCLLSIKLQARTAQGGGGSFQDRKPIGEVGCCESWMAGQIH